MCARVCKQGSKKTIDSTLLPRSECRLENGVVCYVRGNKNTIIMHREVS